ncbi:MAG: glucosaminidase domain-containing protein [Culturomica sp.]|jgi:LysM repeat protein|nr:glucosaminidase domain-containing protein [Culturomica sp.]
MLKITVNIIIFLVATLSVQAQSISRKEFIERYKGIAIEEMKRSGIPASIKLAQGILESGCGGSPLCTEANNYFGIKCHKAWEGDRFHQDDDAENECFRVYKSPEDSWIDHSEFLLSRPRYAPLFDIPTTNYKEWARGLKKAGYATNPQYADMLIKIIEDEKLYVYDVDVPKTQLAMGNVSHKNHNQHIKKTSRSSDVENYRKREEMKNGITCIEAKAGDSFEKIADYYGIKLKRLLKYNDKTNTQLNAGDLVYLKKKKKKAARGYDFHRVKEGDNLYKISQMYGVRMKNLKNYNYLNTNNLVEGEKIYLRSKAGI